MSISFVQIGDLEPDEIGRRRPRPEAVVDALFNGLFRLFERIGQPVGVGLRPPDVLLFTGDLSVGMPSCRGLERKRKFERLFETWENLSRNDCVMIWTIASHELSDYRDGNWPFGPNGPLSKMANLRLIGCPGGTIAHEQDGWQFLAFGGLGGQMDQGVYERYRGSTARWKNDLGGASVVGVSAAEKPGDLPGFCQHVALGGLQEGRPDQRRPRKPIHQLGRPFGWDPDEECVLLLDFVWGTLEDEKMTTVCRVIAPWPDDSPFRAKKPRWLTWPTITLAK